MKRGAIPYTDLLGLRHRTGAVPSDGAVDCLSVTVEILRRAGYADAASDLRQSSKTGCTRLDWEQVSTIGDLEAGDVILSEPDGPTQPPHLSAVVSRVPLRTISSCRRAGVYVISPYRTSDIVAMYRPPVRST